MRASLLFVAALAVTSPLAANWVPIWTPNNVRLHVGETMTATVQVVFSGLIADSSPVDQTFRTDDERVAIANVSVMDHDTHYVQITGVSPGTTTIQMVDSLSGTLDDWPWVRITVVCGTEAPISPVLAVLHGSIGEPVAIQVNSFIPEQAVFNWFLGRDGDRSHPLDGNSTTISFAPTAYGSQYLWVSATSACSTSSAEFRVDVPFSRRRAASK